MERKEMSIRAFAELCKVSHTEIRRRMADLGIEGNGGGRGKAKLLTIGDQDRIAQTLFVPAASQLPRTLQPGPFADGELTSYTPSPLQAHFQRRADERFRREVQSQSALNQFNRNRNVLREALIGLADEDGANLGDEMAEAQLSAAMRQYEHRQNLAGKALGVIPDSSPVPADGVSDFFGPSQ